MFAVLVALLCVVTFAAFHFVMKAAASARALKAHEQAHHTPPPITQDTPEMALWLSPTGERWLREGDSWRALD